MLLEQAEVTLPIYAIWPDPARPGNWQSGTVPSGDYTLITAALDPATGTYRRAERPIRMCR